MQHSGISPQLPALHDALRRGGKIANLLRQRFSHHVQIKRHRQPVIVAGRKDECARVCLPQIQLHIPRRRVSHPVVIRCVFHASLAAMVDGQQAAVRHIAALVMLHVEIIEAEHRARKDFVGGHRAVAGFVAKLPDRTAVALRQQRRALILKLFCADCRLLHAVVLLLFSSN